MFRKCDNIFLLCNVTHLRLGLGKLFMLGIHETWTFFPPNQKELKTKIEPAFSLILYLCSFLFMIQYDGRKMDQHFEKKLIWELFVSFSLGFVSQATKHQSVQPILFHSFPIMFTLLLSAKQHQIILPISLQNFLIRSETKLVCNKIGSIIYMAFSWHSWAVQI